MDIRFETLSAMHWLYAIPVVAGLLVWSVVARRRALGRMIDVAMIARVVPQASRLRPILKAALVMSALIALILAMVDPRWGVTFRPVEQRGVDVMIVLDISKSMLAEDARPNRLVRARLLIEDLMDELGGDRIGLVTFAGTATVRCPLTIDDVAFRNALNTAHPDLAPVGGSRLGDALLVAADAFTDDVPDHKAIVVLTDGEDHESRPVDVARGIAAKQNIPVFTVGLGREDAGEPIPSRTAQGAVSYMEYQGKRVRSRLDGSLLREVAQVTGGAYIPVGVRTVDFGRVYDEHIATVAGRDFEETDIRMYTPRYQWFAGLGLVLLMLESFIALSHRQSQRGRQERFV